MSFNIIDRQSWVSSNAINDAKEVFDVEIQAIAHVREQLNDQFIESIDLMQACTGKIVIVGVGKSGLVGRKISATLSSLGTFSIFLHPTEARHGDLGVINSEDVAIVISNSGESSELVELIPLLRNKGIKVISITSKISSTIAIMSDVVLSLCVEKEACHLNLAPTASTTATMVMGDALAIVLAKIKGFNRDDFYSNHPAGTLGKKLMLTVDKLMNSQLDLISIKGNVSIEKVLFKMTESRMGAISVTDNSGEIIGIVTDGDIRRHISLGGVLATSVDHIKNPNCSILYSGTLVADSLKTFLDKNISAIPIIEFNKQVIGMIHIQDVLRSGVI
jgi:arabinose-5-phosphate isomerase